MARQARAQSVFLFLPIGLRLGEPTPRRGDDGQKARYPAGPGWRQYDRLLFKKWYKIRPIGLMVFVCRYRPATLE